MLSAFDNTINGWCLVKKQSKPIQGGGELDLLSVVTMDELTVNSSPG